MCFSCIILNKTLNKILEGIANKLCDRVDKCKTVNSIRSEETVESNSMKKIKQKKYNFRLNGFHFFRHSCNHNQIL